MTSTSPELCNRPT